MADNVNGIERIRLGSLDPEVVTEDFVERLGKVKKICPHFHFSLQTLGSISCLSFVIALLKHVKNCLL